jgi:hypothetical protein
MNLSQAGSLYYILYIQCKTICISKKIEMDGDFQTHKWPYIWEEHESELSPTPQAYTLKSADIHCIFITLTNYCLMEA